MNELDQKIIDNFPGKVVRKDLIAPLKGHLNVPSYVLEYLLGKYCSSAEPEVIEEGLKQVKKILTENYVRPDQSELIKSMIKENTNYTVIDKIKVRLKETEDKYWAELVNLQIASVNIDEEFIKKYPKILVGGIWAIIELRYDPDIFFKGVLHPFVVKELRPIQLTITSFDDLLEKRKNFSRSEWIDIMIQSIGFEPKLFSDRVKLLFLARLIPMVENNFNLVELGPRGTGKSYVYRELSPYSILVSGGETTVANLFVSNIGRGKIGLVGLWDVVAFDEVAGLSKLSSSSGVQILKDYMESGSFSRGREEISAMASMVFVGNLNQDPQTVLKTSHLFIPFPQEMQDLALIDRYHFYLPGWEIPKMHPDFFGNHFGFVVDYIAELFRYLRTTTFSNIFDKYFSLGNSLNKRDEKAVRKIVSGMVKLIHPDGIVSKAEIEEYIVFGMEMRRRVKEQLKKLGGIEYWNTGFSYIDLETHEEKYVLVPEQSSGGLIPQDQQRPGVIYTVGNDLEMGKQSLFRIEVGVMKGTGKTNFTGIIGKEMKEAIKTAVDYIRSNIHKLSVDKSLKDYDLHVQVVNLMQAKGGSQTGIAFLVGILSALFDKPVKGGTVILGEMSIHGTLIHLDNLAEALQVIRENGGKRVLIPSISLKDLALVPPEVISGLDIGFFTDPADCLFKAI
jgi:ATP-dependent Lon protease